VACRQQAIGIHGAGVRRTPRPRPVMRQIRMHAAGCQAPKHDVRRLVKLDRGMTLCWSDLHARRVTAGSYIPGTGGSRRSPKDTKGVSNRVQEGGGGGQRVIEGALPIRFGTVRTRVQIPRPRPVSSSKSPILDVIRSRRGTAGAQIRGEPGNEAAKFVAMVGRSELGRQRLGRRPQLYIS
jgi:hypothetical protein